MRTPSHCSLSSTERLSRSLAWRWFALAVAGGLTVFGSHVRGQGPAALPTRGVEEVGRTFIGEPLSSYIGHIATLFVTGKHRTVGNGTMQDTVNWVNDPLHSVLADGTGGLAVYAHPDADTRVLLLNGLTGMEVFSQGVLPASGRDQMWDSVLRNLYSQGKPLIWAFAADDTHATTGSNWNLAWNVSQVSSVDLFALKQALRTGAFYPSNGPDISGVSVSGTTITLNLPQTADVLWLRAGQFNSGGAFSQTDATGANRAVKIQPAATTSSLDIASLTVPASSLQFVRAIVRTSTTRYALTQPFRVSPAGVISNPYPTTGTWIKGQTHNHDDAPIDNTTALSTYRSNYAAVGQIATFETAYSYAEVPYQRMTSDGYPDVFTVLPEKVGVGAFDEVTIQGVNFLDGATVQLGPHVLANVTRVSATTLRGSVPTNVPPGVYDVVVTNPDNYRGTLTMGVSVQESTAANGGWQSYKAPDLSWNQTTSIAAIGDEVWVGSMKGAAQFKNGVWSPFVPSGGLNAFSRGVYGIVPDPAGGMWLSSVGLWFRDSAGTFPWQFSTVPSSAEQRWGKAVFDQSGQMWVTSRWAQGIAIRSTSGSWTRLTSSLPSTDTTQAITRDSSGNMWVGFSGGQGIWKWNGSSWTNVPVPGGASGLAQASFASALVTAANGDVWAAVHPMNTGYAPEKSGVVRYIGGSAQTPQIFKAPQLPHPRVTDILIAGNGDVWFSSRAGVARLNTSGQWQTFTTANSGLVSDVVVSMAEDQAGTIWFATDSGVSSYSAFDFGLLSANPISVEPGQSASTTISTTVISPPVAPITFSATGLPAGALASFSPASCSPPCSTEMTVSTSLSTPVGTYPISVTGTTTSGSARTIAVSLVVGRPNHPPVVTNPGSQTSDEQAVVSLPIAASDPDGDALSYGATGLPAGLGIDPTTGAVTGTVAVGASASNAVTVTVTDVNSATSLASFTWTVRAPVLPTRGIEEIGRSYIGEPLHAFIGHLAMLFVTGKHLTAGNGTMQETVDWVNDPLHSVIADGNGGLPVYAHPDAADRVLQLDGLVGMEVFSQGVLPSVARDQMWDVVNSTRSAQGKSLLWGFAADDSHYTVPGAFNFAYNVAWLPVRTMPALKAALRNGAFYTTNGPAISTVATAGTTITLTLDQPSTVLWLRAGQYNQGGTFTLGSTPGANRAVKIETGVTSSMLDVAALGVPPSDLQFVRAIVQTSNAAYAMTQPFAVSGAGAIANPFPPTGLWVKGQTHNHTDAEIGNTTALTTYRADYQAVGQLAAFETAYSYWESPYQRLDSDGFPDVLSVSPAKLPQGAAGTVTIAGVNFAQGAAVQIGGQLLADVVRDSATVLRASVPAGIPAGVYDVVVTNPDGPRGALALGMTIQQGAAPNTGWRTFAAPDLPWNQTTSLASVGDEVWVGTVKGVARFKNDAWSSFTPSGGLNVLSRGIYGIAADAAGGMWFSSTGMWYRDPAGTFPWAFETVGNPAGLTERWGRMAFDAAGRMWVTSRWGEGLAIRDALGGWQRLTQATGLPQDDNQAIARDSAGNMWVGFSASQGIWKWNGAAWQQVPIPGGSGGLPQATYASVIVAGSNGDVWAAVAPMSIVYDPQNAGVVRFASGGATEIFKAPQLPHPRVTDILLARNGDVWFSSRAGVSRRTPSGAWDTYTAQNSGLVSNIVMAMTEDQAGNIWFATDQGVSVLSPSTSTNRPPVVTNPGDQAHAEGASVNVAIAASDPDGESLAYSATGLPTGLSISPTTGVIGGTVAFGAAPTNSVVVSATDGTLSGSTSFTWAVTNTNRVPVVTNPGNQASAEGASVTLTIAASDPDNDPVTYSALGLPAGLAINPTTGVIGGTVSFDAAPTNNVVVSANDGALTGTASFTWTITNVNRPPVVNNPGNRTSTEGTSVTLSIIASDPDGDSLTYGATGLPTGLAIDPTTGVISGTVAFGAPATNSVVVTVSDGQLNATTSFTWTVNRAVPPAPSSLSAQALSSSQIGLSWTDNAPNETGFRIERSRKTGNGSFTPIATVGANVTTYVAGGLNASTRYYFRVRAYNAVGPSSYSNMATAVTLAPTPPAAPSGLAATATSSSQITLGWTDNAGNETGFRIERSPDGTTFALLATIGVNITSYVNGGLTPSTTHHYRVQAVNGAGSSAYSNIAFATTGASTAAPSAPANLVATANSATQVAANWVDTSNDELGFRLERAVRGGAFVEIAVLGPNVRTFVNTGLTGNTTHRYRARAYNTNGTRRTPTRHRSRPGGSSSRAPV